MKTTKSKLQLSKQCQSTANKLKNLFEDTLGNNNAKKLIDYNSIHILIDNLEQASKILIEKN